MTYERFKQLWEQTFPKRPLEEANKEADTKLVDQMSEETVNALIKLADGNSSEFDEIQKKIKEHDL